MANEYNVKTWQAGDRLTAAQLNRIEQGISNVTTTVADISKSAIQTNPGAGTIVIMANLVIDENENYSITNLSWTAQEIADFVTNHGGTNIILKTDTGSEAEGYRYFYITHWEDFDGTYAVNFNDGNGLNISIHVEDNEITTNVVKSIVVPPYTHYLDNGKILQVSETTGEVEWIYPNSNVLTVTCDLTPGENGLEVTNFSKTVEEISQAVIANKEIEIEAKMHSPVLENETVILRKTMSAIQDNTLQAVSFDTNILNDGEDLVSIHVTVVPSNPSNGQISATLVAYSMPDTSSSYTPPSSEPVSP